MPTRPGYGTDLRISVLGHGLRRKFVVTPAFIRLRADQGYAASRAGSWWALNADSVFVNETAQVVVKGDNAASKVTKASLKTK